MEKYKNIFMAEIMLNKDDVMEYHKTHIILLCFLLLKELLIYCFCVRRAYNKLAKEEKREVSRNSNFVKEKDDHYVRVDAVTSK